MTSLAHKALTLGLLAGAGAALATGAAAAPSGTSHYYCNVESYDAQGTPRYTTYYAPVFASLKGQNMQLATAYRAYVAQNYPALDEVKEAQCLSQDDKALAERLWTIQRDDRGRRNTMVAVDWSG